MPSLSGVYTSFSGRTLAVDEGGQLVLLPQGSAPNAQSKLRADAEFWLCRDDGLIGKFGNPDKVLLRVQDQEYHVWVEPRGFSDGENEYGLVAVVPGAEYSNRFLAVDEEELRLQIVDQWTGGAKFRCVEDSI
ncbi:hypothetical protein EYZ11_004031 [Aspergillus tanneri]|uniref:Uncharacterized protein n=1 Tax=Aspergillus tanneri TaxID=1220188 RepID=A0A4S3JNZ4_9EURO|nr:uncharacterized protein ATNIH1004_004702 [Aspergillus tanneri]KAA8648817.1 hypothetical protein ATNIH1004_004702 [Aspergillus tanneri]THC96487.1 hypothetical protein EYZ11_004031 [Aspergillus tanneri]